MEKIEKLSKFILKLAPEVSRKIKNSCRNIKKVYRHKYQDRTISLDHQIGSYWARKILKEFDSVRIDSEESEDCSGKGEIIVRIDPVDGSKHVLCGIDLVASAISVTYKGEVVFGLVINPFSGKFYWAYKNRGAFLNGKRIKVSHEGIETSFVMREDPTSKLFRDDAGEFRKCLRISEAIMKNSFRSRNIGLGSLSPCWVAEGAASAYLGLSGTTKLYDIEAAMLIAEEAGARACDLDGNLITSGSLAQLSGKGGSKKHLNIGIVIANPKAFGQINKILRRSCKF
ncbi:MAG: inositol monophosphatase family protein [bacterium]|nr:inositol monophosphatase family protein [bacterium]